MNNEIEAQFLDIDKDEIRKKLRSLGAECKKPEVLMKRVVFDLGEHCFARVRDEGNRIVMTYKNVSDDTSIMGTKEVNVEVDDYDKAILFLQSCGLRLKATQETYRESWKLDDIEFDIDTWPWIPTFLEIEGPSEQKVWETAKMLGLDRKKAKFGSVDSTYHHYYGVDMDIVNLHTPVITFECERPDWAKEEKFKKKN
ncbi:class IV adenylate cyclase [Candidatus Saccharibacteria bacterium]|nr:class IV adenylate cyclase [Candidatus Saccharibacteria bacterium]